MLSVSARGGTGLFEQVSPAAVTPAVVMPASATGTVSLTGNGNAIPNGESSTFAANYTNFGPTATDGSIPVTRTYTITNSGVGTLTMVGGSPITFTGAGAQYFSASAPSSNAIAAGSTATFTVTFTPMAAGVQTAVCNIATSDPSSPFTFTVQGGSAAPAVSLAGGEYTYTTGTGTGAGAKNGDLLVVNYSLYEPNGNLNQTSIGNKPFQFELGVGAVIKGWDEGMPGVEVGQTRDMVIPSALAYGANGAGTISPNENLIFAVTVLDIISVQGEPTGANNAWVAVTDGENTPSATNGTDFGAAQTPVTNTFQITEPGGNLKALLGTPELSVGGSTAFKATQPNINNSDNAATFTITYTPTSGTSQAIVTLVNATSGEPNYSFVVQAEGDTPDDGSLLTANTNVISGYAFDPLHMSTPDTVEIDIAGGPVHQTITANQASPELQSQFGTTSNNFTYTMPVLSAGPHVVSVYAINATTGIRTLIGSTTITSQNSLFDEHYYLLMNPDVAAAVTAGKLTSGYQHYIQFGQYEGRSPSPYWNEAWYLKQNPDVAAAVKSGKVTSGFMHYYLYGQYENRGGLLYFNTQYYLQNNPDVASAITSGSVASAFEHFVLYGQYEGRSPMLYFSSTVYDAHNPDILPSITGETFTSDFEHFIEYGQFEDRIASSFYNEQTYLADNSDVAAAVRSGQFADGFQQWLEYGQYEGRTAV
jgi:hypothetical protein